MKIFRKKAVCILLGMLLGISGVFPIYAAETDMDTQNELVFTDVSPEDWYYGTVYDVYDIKLMTGLDKVTFGPQESLSRAQLVAVLYRMEKSPEMEFESVFGDVMESEWYTNAVIWGYKNGIISGYSNGMFGPDDTITREQLAIILYRYAEYKKYDVSARSDLNTYPDTMQVNEYAKDAVSWCVEKGIILGDGGTLNPHGNVSRAVSATMISRFVNQVQIDEQRIRNQSYRDILEGNAEYNYGVDKAYQFGVIDMNGDGVYELLVYTYDPAIEDDMGPNYMLTYDGEACGAGKGWGAMHNTEYCVDTKHFMNIDYYEDGTYCFRVFDFSDPYFGDELIYDGKEGESDYPFSFYVDADGKYSYGDRNNSYLVDKLSDEQVAYVEGKLSEYFPYKEKATAPYAVTEENLNKYLPIDNEGIREQLFK